MVWRTYYLIKKDNYLKISTLLICIFSVFAIILNIEGSNCITQINSLALFNSSSNENKGIGNSNNEVLKSGVEVQRQSQQEQPEQPQQQQQNQELPSAQEQNQDTNSQSQQELMQQSYELRKYCFLVTNLYVYSLFGIIIGFLILVFWYIRYKKIWSNKKKGSIN